MSELSFVIQSAIILDVISGMYCIVNTYASQKREIGKYSAIAIIII